eukprot:Sspe_Gene.113781::Locus_98524_Transcript_1_1_Confidence_1.000_Length_515::g.113781::m.113781
MVGLLSPHLPQILWHTQWDGTPLFQYLLPSSVPFFPPLSLSFPPLSIDEWNDNKEKENGNLPHPLPPSTRSNQGGKKEGLPFYYPAPTFAHAIARCYRHFLAPRSAITSHPPHLPHARFMFLLHPPYFTTWG